MNYYTSEQGAVVGLVKIVINQLFLKSSLFWDVTQLRSVGIYLRFGKPIDPIFKIQAVESSETRVTQFVTQIQQW